jgi:hypothetical protein
MHNPAANGKRDGFKMSNIFAKTAKVGYYGMKIYTPRGQHCSVQKLQVTTVLADWKHAPQLQRLYS